MKKLAEQIRNSIAQRKKNRRLTTILTAIAGILVFITVYTLILPALALEQDVHCGKEAHEHTDACYEEVLKCGREEHTHEEGCCDEDGNLICGKEEHSHDESCYESKLVCGKERHVHTESCYKNPEAEELTNTGTQMQNEKFGTSVSEEDKTDSNSTETVNNKKEDKKEDINTSSDSKKDNKTDKDNKDSADQNEIVQGQEEKLVTMDISDYMTDDTGLWYYRPSEKAKASWKEVDKDTTLRKKDLVCLHLALRFKKGAVTDNISEAVYEIPDSVQITDVIARWLNDDSHGMNQLILGKSTPDMTSKSRKYLAGKYEIAKNEKTGKWELTAEWDPHLISQNAKKPMNVWADMYVTGKALKSEGDDTKKIIFAEKTKDHKEISAEYADVKDDKEAERKGALAISLSDYMTQSTGMWYFRSSDKDKASWKKVRAGTILEEKDLVCMHLAMRFKKGTVTKATYDTKYTLPENIELTDVMANWHNSDGQGMDQLILGTATPDNPSGSKNIEAGTTVISRNDNTGRWTMTVDWNSAMIDENAEKDVNVWTDIYITGKSVKPQDDGSNIVVFSNSNQDEQVVATTFEGVDREDEETEDKSAREDGQQPEEDAGAEAATEESDQAEESTREIYYTGDDPAEVATTDETDDKGTGDKTTGEPAPEATTAAAEQTTEASEGTTADGTETPAETATEAAPAGEEYSEGTLSYEGEDYTVTVSYGADARLPKDVKLDVREIKEDSSSKAEQKEFSDYFDQASEAIKNENKADVKSARFFDITFIDGQKEIEPSAPINVKIQYKKAEAIEDNQEVAAVHLPDKADNEVLSDVEVQKAGDGVKEVEFTADSFSVYGIVYTVDYYINGYEFHMPGSGTMKLSELFRQLKIDEDVHNVEKVDFTDETLLKITEDPHVGLIGGFDWTIKSLKPFTSWEKLTITMKDGKIYEIDVTDGQSYAVYIDFKDADGKAIQPSITGGNYYIYAAVKMKDNHGGDGGDNCIYCSRQQVKPEDGHATITINQFERQNGNPSTYTYDDVINAGKTVEVKLVKNDNEWFLEQNGVNKGTITGGTIIKSGTIDNGYEFTINSGDGITNITAQKPKPYTYTIKAESGQINFTEGPWYLYGEVTRSDGVYFYTRKIDNNGPIEGTVDKLVHYTGINQSAGETVPSNGDAVTFALLRPKDSNQSDQLGYFWTADNMNVKALSGASVDSRYTLQVNHASHHSNVILQKAPDASITLKSYNRSNEEEESADLSASGTYFLMGKLSFRDGLEDKNRYFLKKIDANTRTAHIREGFAAANGVNDTHYLTGTRSYEPCLVFVPGDGSVTEAQAINMLEQSESNIVIYRNGSTVESYRLSTGDGTIADPDTVIELKKLPEMKVGASIRNAANDIVAKSDTDTYNLLVELSRGQKKAYAYSPLSFDASGKMEPVSMNDVFKETTTGENWYYREEDTPKFYIVKGDVANHDAAVSAEKRYAENQIMGTYRPEFVFDEESNTVNVILREFSVPQGSTYNVRIDMMNKEQTATVAATPKLNANYYVLAYLTPKGTGSKGQILGWKILDVTEQNLNDNGTWNTEIPADGFNACYADYAANEVKIGYNKEAYDISFRLYHSNQACTTYQDIVNKADDSAPSKYDFKGVYTKDNDPVDGALKVTQDNTSVIRLHQAYDKDYGLRVYVDNAGLSIPEGSYIVKVTLHHQNGGNTYAFAKLKIDSNTGGDTPAELEFYTDDQNRIWRDQNGQCQNGSNYTFTGNEKGADIEVLSLNNTGENFAEWSKPSSQTTTYSMIIPGTSINMYTYTLGNRETEEDISAQKNHVYDVLRFTEDVNGISKGELDEFLEMATDFGLYTELLSLHATDMESNIGAAVLSGQIGADYGFSGNNTQVNRIKVLKRFYDSNENPQGNKQVTLKLYTVESYNEDTGDYTLGSEVSTKTGTTNNEGIAYIEFDKLPAGKYVLKELLNGKEYDYNYNNSTNGIVKDGNTNITFKDRIIEVENININYDYFGQINSNVELSPVLTHSRHATVVVGNQNDYERLKNANGGEVSQDGTRVVLAGEDGKYPVLDIPADMENLRSLSVNLASIGNSKTVRIVNTTLDEINTNNGFKFKSDGRYIVVNIDMTNASSVATANIDTYIDGVRLMADFGAGGNEDSSKVLYNFITRDSRGNAHPYTGKINTATQAAGIILAPSAIVADLGGNFGGTIICREAQHTGSEIHSDSANKIQNINTLLTNGVKKDGNLEIKKSFTDPTRDRTTWFTFKVTLLGSGSGNNGEYYASGLKEGEKVKFNNGEAIVQVRAQNKVVITGLPAEIQYKVEEISTADSEHYELDHYVPENGQGTISPHETSTVEAVNKRKDEGLELKKTWINGITGGNTKIFYTLYQSITKPEYVTVNLKYKEFVSGSQDASGDHNGLRDKTKTYKVMKGSALNLLIDHALSDAKNDYSVTASNNLTFDNLTTREITVNGCKYYGAKYKTVIPSTGDNNEYTITVDYGNHSADEFLEPIIEIVPPDENTEGVSVVEGHREQILTGSATQGTWTKNITGLTRTWVDENETDPEKKVKPYYYYVYEKTQAIVDGEDVDRYETTYSIVDKSADEDGLTWEIKNEIKSYTWLEVTKKWPEDMDANNSKADVVLYRRKKGENGRPERYDRKTIDQNSVGSSDKHWTVGWYMLDPGYDYFVFEPRVDENILFNDRTQFAYNTTYWQMNGNLGRQINPLEGFSLENEDGYYVPVNTEHGGCVEIRNEKARITFRKQWPDAVNQTITVDGTTYNLSDLEIRIKLKRYSDGNTTPDTDEQISQSFGNQWASFQSLFEEKTMDGAADADTPNTSGPSAYEVDNWNYVWNNLPSWGTDSNHNIVTYTYGVEEVSVKVKESNTDLTESFLRIPGEAGYKQFSLYNRLNKQNISITKEWEPVPEGSWTITADLKVSKKLIKVNGRDVTDSEWSDWEDYTAENVTPVSVTNEDYDNATKKYTKTVSLPRYDYDESGKKLYELKFTAVERPINGFTTTVIGEGTSEITITNRSKNVIVKVKKKWDPEPADPGAKVTVQLKRYMKPLPTTNPGVKVEWNDANNQDGNRPQSLNATLYENGTNKGSVTLSDSNSWQAQISDMPAYRIVGDQAQPISYTWRLQDNEGYSNSSSFDANTSITTITNTHQPEETSRTLAISWDDANNQDGSRPNTVTATLSNGQSVELNQGNNWTGTISGLPKKSNGSDVEYSWNALSIDGYTLRVTTNEGSTSTLEYHHEVSTSGGSTESTQQTSTNNETVHLSVVDVQANTFVNGYNSIEVPKGTTVTITLETQSGKPEAKKWKLIESNSFYYNYETINDPEREIIGTRNYWSNTYNRYLYTYSVVINEDTGIGILANDNSDIPHEITVSHSPTGYIIPSGVSLKAMIMNTKLNASDALDQAVDNFETQAPQVTHSDASPSEAPAGYVNDTSFEEQNITLSLSKSEGWEKSFGEQPKTDPFGNPYYYYVVETDRQPADYWIESYNGDLLSGSGTIEITNKTDSEKTDIDFTKIWKKSNLQEIWPDNTTITVEVTREGDNYFSLQYDISKEDITAEREITAKSNSTVPQNELKPNLKVVSQGTSDKPEYLFRISGLAKENNSGADWEYHIKETNNSKDGYRAAQYSGDGSTEFYIQSGGVITNEVASYALPETGGIGTGIFRTLGIMLIGFALVFYGAKTFRRRGA